LTKTLQQHLDIAYRALQKTKAPNPPNEEVLGRERAFRDQADKIEKLRQQRVARETLVYEVVRHRGHWRILHQEKHSKAFGDQEAAIDAAKATAAKAANKGREVQVILRRVDGQVVNYALADEGQ
jgi:hypothetical protein